MSLQHNGVTNLCCSGLHNICTMALLRTAYIQFYRSACRSCRHPPAQGAALSNRCERNPPSQSLYRVLLPSSAMFGGVATSRRNTGPTMSPQVPEVVLSSSEAPEKQTVRHKGDITITLTANEAAEFMRLTNDVTSGLKQAISTGMSHAFGLPCRHFKVGEFQPKGPRRNATQTWEEVCFEYEITSSGWNLCTVTPESCSFWVQLRTHITLALTNSGTHLFIHALWASRVQCVPLTSPEADPDGRNPGQSAIPSGTPSANSDPPSVTYTNSRCRAASRSRSRSPSDCPAHDTNGEPTGAVCRCGVRRLANIACGKVELVD